MLAMIDWERKIRDLIKKGSVFYFPEDTFSRKYSHYFVVLNNDPNVGDIFMVSAKSFNTKDVCRFENGNFPRETFVDVAEGESSILNKLTLFDCNSVISKSIVVLAGKMKEGALQDKGYIEEEILKKICIGVSCSPVIENDIKDKIC